MSSNAAHARLALVLFVTVQAVVWSHSRFAHVGIRGGARAGTSLVQELGLVKRTAASEPSILPLLSGHNGKEEECAPISVPPAHQCQHVQDSCPPEDTFLSIDYLNHYFCASPAARPFVFAGLLVWLVFLFSTLGISASDFFCPNLAALSQLLGLEENVAGVTFLAFGNGSPDVFSTFSAMRADAGSLAIGELLGAASFIVSVVVGSMCIVRPFDVPRHSFLRDVGFFTVAVTMLLVILWDQEIRAWEAAMLVGLYAIYVFVVVAGTWWEKRAERKRLSERTVRNEYADEEIPDIARPWMEPYRDDPSPTRLAPPLPSPSGRMRAISSPAAPNGDVPSLALSTSSLPPAGNRSTRSSRSASPSHPRLGAMPSFSLVGALEFRDVVASLQRRSAASMLSAFESPVSPFVGGHYHAHPHSPQTNRRSSSYTARTDDTAGTGGTDDDDDDDDDRTRASETDPWDAALGVHMHRVPHSVRSSRSPARSPSPEGDTEPNSPEGRSPSMRPTLSVAVNPRIPLISTTPASPRSESSATDVANFYGSSTARRSHSQTRGGGSGGGGRMSKRGRVIHMVRHTLHVLFPTLHGWWGKSWMGKIASVLATPAVLALTVTLPVYVIETPSDEDEKLESFSFANGHVGTGGRGAGGGGGGVQEGRLVDFEEEGVERHLTAAEVASEIEREDLEDHLFNKYLVACQLLLGPLFCVAVLFAHHKNEGWLLGATAVTSLVAATLVLVFADRGNDRMAQMGRCFMGFAVAVVWIMAIADEVVNVLKTFGHIFGLSDAIIGLTIFAVGNSLADFVANLAVAAFAPVMGFSACFGGPMLNILLGVGISGSYVINAAGGEPFRLHFSTTLLVSTIGLLALLVMTMLFVPLNGFHLPKKWGVFLIICYIVIMTTNVIVEIKR